MKKDKTLPPAKALAQRITRLGRTYGTDKVFRDFVEMGALALSNAVDRAQFEAREAQYMRLIADYKTLEHRQEFPAMLGDLALALERDPTDILGPLFNELGLGNKRLGQSFTPKNLADMMARMTLGPEAAVKSLIEEHGFFTACEPCCGAGVMIYSLADALRDEGINYQTSLHVQAVDLDLRCVHMTYLQCSLLHIPAIIHHGDTLRMKFTGTWYTPAHILGGWSYKLRRRGIDEHNASWWRDLVTHERIDFLKRKEINLNDAFIDRATRPVLDAKYSEALNAPEETA